MSTITRVLAKLNFFLQTSTTPRTTAPTNCREFLDKRLQVRWKLEDDYVEITLSAKMEEDQYVAFGLSGSPHKPQMVKLSSFLNSFSRLHIEPFLGRG